MLAMLALAAFMSDADAQTRRSSDVNKSTPARQSTSRSSSSQTRSSSGSSQVRRSAPASQNRKPNDNKKNNATATRPSAPDRPAARPSSGNDKKPSTTVTRPSAPDNRPSSSKPSGNKNDFKPGDQNKPVQVTRPAPNRPQGNNKNDRPGVRPGDRPDARPDVRPGKGPGPGKPVQVRPHHKPEPPRIHPRERDFMRWDRPSYWWSHNNHYYGYRVRVLPTNVLRHVYRGITYYCYNDIWYRPYGGYYVVCRPPYGLSLAANIISDIAWTAVRLSYYNTVANTYSQINENNVYIAEQNAIIAQNNATIAAQNATIAQNQQMAQTAYTLANSLGLVQSYAAANSEYFYQDGVFYSKDASGEYRVIAPPAGALVENLPEDFDLVTLNDGNEYYKVDDTIYKVTIAEGKPYFEVVGQQYN